MPPLCHRYASHIAIGEASGKVLICIGLANWSRAGLIVAKRKEGAEIDWDYV